MSTFLNAKPKSFRFSAASVLILLPALSASLSAQQVGVIEHPLYSDYAPAGITDGPDGRLWFTESYSPTIGSMTTAGLLREYPIPEIAGGGITAGPDGALWFTTSENDIGRITTSGAVTLFPIPTPGAGPAGITTGPDGALWFAENSANQIGRLTTAGQFTEYSVPNTQPDSITSGPDGALWFTEFAGGIGRITTDGGVTEYTVPGPAKYAGTSGITTGPDGALWFTEEQKDFIGRITTDGVVTQYAYPVQGQGAAGITAGPGDDLWFASRGQIGRVTTSGVFTFYELDSPNTSPRGITTGPNGALWVTEFTAGAESAGIDELIASGASLSVSPTSGSSGQAITITGSGYAPNEVVNVNSHSTGADLLATVTADPTGAFTLQTNVGIAFNGDDSLVGVGQSSGTLGVAQYSVMSLLFLTPESGLPGSTATAEGSGLAPGYSVALFMNKIYLGTAQTNNLGSFALKFTVPANLSPGDQTVFASVGSDPVLLGYFTVN